MGKYIYQKAVTQLTCLPSHNKSRLATRSENKIGIIGTSKMTEKTLVVQRRYGSYADPPPGRLLIDESCCYKFYTRRNGSVYLSSTFIETEPYVWSNLR